MTGNVFDLFNRGWHSTLIATRARKFTNQLRYGAIAPIPNMHFEIDPHIVRERYHPSGHPSGMIGNRFSGAVMGGTWDQSRRDVTRSIKYRSCAKHFLHNVPWEDTPAIPYGLNQIAVRGRYDGCETRAELMARYEALDDLWEKTIKVGKLPEQATLKSGPRRGILMHVDRNGRPLFGNQGFHRLAIAQLAKLKTIPVLLGAVHPGAINTPAFAKLMKRQI